MKGLRPMISRWAAVLFAAALVSLAGVAQAATGLSEIAGAGGDGPVTIFYPSSDEAKPVDRVPFTLQVALHGAPARGNRRLVVISHGSGGSPWAHSDLAHVLVDAGFVVALPEHRGDNYKDMSLVGPESWKRRPAEVSRAIDAVGRDARFAAALRLDRVGMYGMSAGGHTALTLAGGRWSSAKLKQHCEANIADDFHACVGLTTRLSGGPLDELKITVALAVIRWKLDDAERHFHVDPRIVAIVAGVPFAVDFDPASLAQPRVPLALVTAARDRWLAPRFHSDVVLGVCSGCERLADLPTGGHGALLSPLPPGLTGLAGDLLNDPPGFDRAAMMDVDRKIAAYFRKYLLP